MQVQRHGNLLATLLVFAMVGAAEPALAQARPELVRLTSGERLVARPTNEPFVWETAFGKLEIAPEQIAKRSGGQWDRGDTVAEAHRFRLADGTLHISRAASIEGSRVVLVDRSGGRLAVALADVLEVDDLPRSGAGGRVDLLPLARAPSSRARRSPGGLGVVTQPAHPPAGSASPPETRDAPGRSPKRRMGFWPRAGQFFLGGCGLTGGALVGALLGVAADESPEGAAVGAITVGTVGAAGVAWGVGQANDGTGTFLGPLVGAALGSVVGTLLAVSTDMKAAPITILFPLAGSTLGYAASEQGATGSE